MFSFIQKMCFQRLYSDLERRVKEEKKTDSSWLMGYMQGLGNRKLTGFQFAALVDLLLISPNMPVEPQKDSTPDVLPNIPETEPVPLTPVRFKIGP